MRASTAGGVFGSDACAGVIAWMSCTSNSVIPSAPSLFSSLIVRTIHLRGTDYPAVSTDTVPSSPLVTYTVPLVGSTATPPGSAHTVYVVNSGYGTVSVIDTGSGTVTDTITVGRNPHGVAVDGSAHTVYVTNANDGTVSVIDTGSGTVTDTITVGAYLGGVAVDG